MRSFVGSLVVTVLLVIAGLVLWSAAHRQERLAGAERDLAALQYERAAAALDDLGAPSLVGGLIPGFDAADTASRVGAMSEYWQSKYDAVAGDPDFALIAANAAFRAVERDGGPWATVVGRLDAVVKRYADVLRSEPDNEDAAYNFEFAVRRRAMIAAAKQAVPPAGATARTLHGQAGAPPASADMKQFKMIVPMLPQEREEAEQAGRGARRVRKG